VHPLDHRLWIADPEHVVLSWPARFVADSETHRAIAALKYGDPLLLRPRENGNTGWELANQAGVTVGRMAQKFVPPAGEILAVRVAGILVRHAKEEKSDNLRCTHWELVLPEIEYKPQNVEG
jgi:ATP-dependent DNA helicase RecQ